MSRDTGECSSSARSLFTSLCFYMILSRLARCEIPSVCTSTGYPSLLPDLPVPLPKSLVRSPLLSSFFLVERVSGTPLTVTHPSHTRVPHPSPSPLLQTRVELFLR